MHKLNLLQDTFAYIYKNFLSILKNKNTLYKYIAPHSIATNAFAKIKCRGKVKTLYKYSGMTSSKTKKSLKQRFIQNCPFSALIMFVFVQDKNLGQIIGAIKMHLSPPEASVHFVVAEFLLYVPAIVCGCSVWCALLYVISSFAINLTRKRELIALHLLSF